MSAWLRGDLLFERMAGTLPFPRLHPRVAAFLKQYLAGERATRFGDQWVISTHFPPWPSPAFDGMLEALDAQAPEPRLHSVTLGVTNRCPYRCWHCYNAGRCTDDLPLDALRRTARQLQDLGSAMVGLSGGEPLLRADLEGVAEAFDERTCLTVNTTGWGLTLERARSLARSGLFAIGVSLDSADPAEHDRLRGHVGAFGTAVRALRASVDAGLYPYVVAVARRELLEPTVFEAYARAAGAAGAREIHLLEPCPVGRLAGQQQAVLTPAERRRLTDLQRRTNAREDMPSVSSLTRLESPAHFGCGAGLTHLYVDGSGEVCPCNLVPLSFGNVQHEPLASIVARLRRHFRQPRATCAGRVLGPHVPPGPQPTPLEVSEGLCDEHLPRRHARPGFVRARRAAPSEVGAPELRAAYDGVHASYDRAWLAQAGRPVEALVGRLDCRPVRRAFEAGCGTGFATGLLAARLAPTAELTAVDLSAGMLSQAAARLRPYGPRVRLVAGDALAALAAEADLDLVLTTWCLGYIPVDPFYAAAARALRPGGCLALLAHRQDSPREPLEIFAQLVAREPEALQRRVAFAFPRDAVQVAADLARAGFAVEQAWEGQVTFACASPQKALDHLLESGAGTAFYEALDPLRREALRDAFLRALAEHRPAGTGVEVVHEYVACIARR